MSQMGFFDVSDRYAGLDKKKDPLREIDALVPWERFRPRLEALWRKPPEEKRGPGGRKPWDAILIFKGLILQSLYNLGDDDLEYQLRDRLSFIRFLGLGLEETVPDATTFWLYREALVKADALKDLFADFDAWLKDNGYLAKGGQIVDASIVPAPIQRNSRKENAAIKAGEMPEDWEETPAKLRQKDRDARWTKKHGKSHYGYKNHVSVDRRHKFIRRYTVTDAATHDSRCFTDLIDPDNTASDAWADAAYRSAETEAWLADRRLRSRIHRKARRGKPLTKREQQGNKTRSKVRARVEHVFGAQANEMGGTLVRTIGLARARAKIGARNLAYNMRRLMQLERLARAGP